jgi:hypothetical protein
MIVRFFDIQWDTSDEEIEKLRTPEECGLPSEATFNVDDDLDLEDEGADALSDRYGFCVLGCSYEVQTQGKCPKCGADFEYGCGELQDDAYYYSVKCPKCHWTGKEEYSLVFDGQTKD